MKVPIFIVRYALERWDYPPFMYENYGIYLSKSQAISEAKKLYKKYAEKELITVVIEQQKEVYSAIDGKKLSPNFEILFRIDAFDGFHKVKDDEQHIKVSQETLKFTLMRLDETQRETIQSERNVLRII